MKVPCSTRIFLSLSHSKINTLLTLIALSIGHKLRQQQLSPSEIRKTGFPLSPELVYREIVIMNGTLQAALFALQYGISMNIAGGTHHAFTDRGRGLLPAE